MNRRGFLKALAAAPAVAALAPLLPALEQASPIFAGEIGTYQGVRIYTVFDLRAAKLEALARSFARTFDDVAYAELTKEVDEEYVCVFSTQISEQLRELPGFVEARSQPGFLDDAPGRSLVSALKEGSPAWV